jgi:hypothetical protein
MEFDEELYDFNNSCLDYSDPEVITPMIICYPPLPEKHIRHKVNTIGMTED